MKLPSFQFYPADWRKDPGVQSLDYHDRGVWFEIMCIMHESDERGKLMLNGKPMTESALSRLLGLDNQSLTTTLTTLLDRGVASREPETGVIYCRRMVRDEMVRKIRQQAGKLGGNPVLLKQKSTTGVKQIPTPSSSSSASASTEREGEAPPNLIRAERRPANVEEVIERGKIINVTEDECRKWYRDCQACNWTRGDGTPFDNWPRQLVIHRDKLEERKFKANGAGNGHTRPPFISEIRTMIQTKEERIAALRFEHAEEVDGNYRWPREKAAQKAECAGLVKEVEELKAKLAHTKA